MKALEAIKCKDAWLVTIKETIKVLEVEDVYTLIKREGMKLEDPPITTETTILARGKR